MITNISVAPASLIVMLLAVAFTQCFSFADWNIALVTLIYTHMTLVKLFV